MSGYPAINFTGNKRKLTDWISQQECYAGTFDDTRVSVIFSKIEKQVIVTNVCIKYTLRHSVNNTEEMVQMNGMTKKNVRIDMYEPFEAYVGSGLWNGWAIPYFEFGVAKKVMEWSNLQQENVAEIDRLTMYFDKEKDAFIERDSSGDGLEFPGTDVHTEDGVKHLYPVGGYSWIWDVC